MPPNPKTAAMMAMIRNVAVQVSISFLLNAGPSVAGAEQRRQQEAQPDAEQGGLHRVAVDERFGAVYFLGRRLARRAVEFLGSIGDLGSVRVVSHKTSLGHRNGAIYDVAA